MYERVWPFYSFSYRCVTGRPESTLFLATIGLSHCKLFTTKKQQQKNNNKNDGKRQLFNA